MEVAFAEQLERDIVEEGAQLAALKDSLERSDRLTHQTIVILEAFDSRVGELEASMLPIHRIMQTMDCSFTNVEKATRLVKSIMQYIDLLKREELVLSSDPSKEGIDEYIASMERVRSAYTSMMHSSLQFCRNTTGKLEGLWLAAIDRSKLAFSSWIAEVSSPVDLRSTLTMELEVKPGLLSEGRCRSLGSILQYLSVVLKPEEFGLVIKGYEEQRSSFISKSVCPLFNIEFDRKIAYQRGSHPLIQAINGLVTFFENEHLNIDAIMPSSQRAIALDKLLLKNVAQLNEAVAVIVARIHKSPAYHDFWEQTYLFDILEQFNRRWVDIREDIAVSMALKQSLAALTKVADDYLSTMLEEVKGRSIHSPGGPATSSYVLPQNVTVFELTSTCLASLKKMLEYDTIIEALLSRPKSDSIIGVFVKDPQSASMLVQFYAEILTALEQNLQKRSLEYRRNPLPVIFLLNNYHYILKALRTSLASISTVELENRFEELLGSAKETYMNGWRAIAAPLAQPTQNAREKLKQFIGDLENACKSLAPLAVADSELMVFLRNETQSIVIPLYTAFYNQNQQLFMASSSKYAKYDMEWVESQLTTCFST